MYDIKYITIGIILKVWFYNAYIINEYNILNLISLINYMINKINYNNLINQIIN